MCSDIAFIIDSIKHLKTLKKQKEEKPVKEMGVIEIFDNPYTNGYFAEDILKARLRYGDCHVFAIKVALKTKAKIAMWTENRFPDSSGDMVIGLVHACIKVPGEDVFFDSRGFVNYQELKKDYCITDRHHHFQYITPGELLKFLYSDLLVIQNPKTLQRFVNVFDRSLSFLDDFIEAEYSDEMKLLKQRVSDKTTERKTPSWVSLNNSWTRSSKRWSRSNK